VVVLLDDAPSSTQLGEGPGIGIGVLTMAGRRAAAVLSPGLTASLNRLYAGLPGEFTLLDLVRPSQSARLCPLFGPVMVVLATLFEPYLPERLASHGEPPQRLSTPRRLPHSCSVPLPLPGAFQHPASQGNRFQALRDQRFGVVL
jgi:hypothetical protein